MVRKSSKHLHVTYGTIRQLFCTYKVSSAGYTEILPTGNRTSNHRMQSRNSLTEQLVHIAHKRSQTNKLWQLRGQLT